MNQGSKIKILQAVVVDDERLARNELINLLKSHPEVNVAGQADSVESAKTEIERVNPDVLFLDIQMPRKSGFDLINEISFSGKIIFITAYDEYAIRAFEVNALDYLLKPVSPDRLAASLMRLRDEAPETVFHGKKMKYDDQLFLHFGNQLRFLRISNIVLIKSEADYSKVHLTGGTTGLVLKTMREWEERLPENHFCRIHRSAIVNIGMIDRIEKWFNYGLRIYLPGNLDPINISRRNAVKIKERFG